MLATADTVNTSQADGSLLLNRRMWPFTGLVLSARVVRIAFQLVLAVSSVSARITVEVFWVALLRRSRPLPGSASVVVVENVKLIEIGPPTAPETPEVPDVPETPEMPDTPEMPLTPDTPDTPEIPDVPQTPLTPLTPETPDRPLTPDTPLTPETPETPDTPMTPDTPEIPDRPLTPLTPDTPDTPDTPVAPTSPARSKVRVMGSLLANGLAA